MNRIKRTLALVVMNALSISALLILGGGGAAFATDEIPPEYEQVCHCVEWDEYTGYCLQMEQGPCEPSAFNTCRSFCW